MERVLKDCDVLGIVAHMRRFSFDFRQWDSFALRL